MHQQIGIRTTQHWEVSADKSVNNLVEGNQQLVTNANNPTFVFTGFA
jgi:hypothetical protein